MEKQLIALRDAISALLALPESARSVLAALIGPSAPAAAPEPHKSNGADHGPPPAFEALRRNPDRPPRPKAKARPKRSKPTPAEIVANETALLDAMRDNPGVGVMELARSLSANTSTISERLKRLQRRGEVERDAAGMWRLPERPPRPSPSA